MSAAGAHFDVVDPEETIGGDADGEEGGRPDAVVELEVGQCDRGDECGDAADVRNVVEDEREEDPERPILQFEEVHDDAGDAGHSEADAGFDLHVLLDAVADAAAHAEEAVGGVGVEGALHAPRDFFGVQNDEEQVEENDEGEFEEGEGSARDVEEDFLGGCVEEFAQGAGDGAAGFVGCNAAGDGEEALLVFGELVAKGEAVEVDDLPEEDKEDHHGEEENQVRHPRRDLHGDHGFGGRADDVVQKQSDDDREDDLAEEGEGRDAEDAGDDDQRGGGGAPAFTGGCARLSSKIVHDVGHAKDDSRERWVEER